MSKIWEILRKFKHLCENRGWRTSENEDWVEIGDVYHNFLWARNVHFSSFKKITSDKKCVVRKGLGYHVAEATYTAWLLSEEPSKNIVKVVSDNPEFSNRIALYDMSEVTIGRNCCTKLNKTDSQVFREFERFLQTELGARVQPILVLSNQKLNENSYSATIVA